MKNSPPIQLSLGVSLKDDATFDNFYVSGTTNSVAVKALQSFSREEGEQNLVVWGTRGAGLTHLLQACSHLANKLDTSSSDSTKNIQYLPIREIMGYSPGDICENLGAVSLVCIDGIDEVCGNREWEQAIFHLFNRIRDNGNRLLISSHTSPPALPIILPDLKSRVLGSVVYHIEGLCDEGKAEALQARARFRGMDMSDEVTRYILNRAPRDMGELFQLLNKLDEATLRHQRKLSVPFVKDVLKL